MPSPIRRSARGQLPTAPSTSSSLSSRLDRSTRAGSGHKSATPRSLSSEDISEPPIARRSQRQPAQKEDASAKEPEAAEENDEEVADEEEITRCICGHQEYPGPPLSEAFANVPDPQSEDAGGLFILCDGCSVWQHGGCVGIVEESQSPDKYYCEECRPKQHAVHTDSRGDLEEGALDAGRSLCCPRTRAEQVDEFLTCNAWQRYSLYLPLHPKAQHRKSSVSKHDEKAKRERESVANRGSVDPSTGKRRATMRSKEHDDEEEQLKRAIEESKREVDGGNGSVRRNGKRGRDESEDNKLGVKRQRRASESVPSTGRSGGLEEDSDDATTTAGKLKKAKAEANQSARQAEQKERDQEREKARAEAAGRRQERARSRRGDEAEPTDETTPKPSSNKASPPAPSSQPPSPPPAEKPPARRGPGKRPGKKLGNNQYTKKSLEAHELALHGRRRQANAQPSGSGDDASEIIVNGGANGSNGAGSKSSPGVMGPNENGTGKGKFGRGKKGMANGNGVRALAPGEQVERTFTNMHAALLSMSAFVTREQEETLAPGVSTGKSPADSDTGTLALGGPAALTSAASESSSEDRRFEDLSSAEMAVRLMKGISDWQRQWGHMAAA